MTEPTRPPVVVDEPRALRLASWTVLPVLGAGLGLLLAFLVPWLLGLPWIPFEGPLRLVRSLPQPWTTAVPVAAGAVAGVALALVWAHERLVVTVTADEVVLARGDERQPVTRGEAAAVFRDGRDVVVLDPAGAERARASGDVSVPRLRAALAAHGYAWRDEDPYAGAYRVWVEDGDGLPAGADAVLRARRRALEAEKGAEEAAALRRELARLGVVVRDEAAVQYWRPAAQEPQEPKELQEPQAPRPGSPSGRELEPERESRPLDGTTR